MWVWALGGVWSVRYSVYHEVAGVIKKRREENNVVE